MSRTPEVVIAQLDSDEDARVCAEIMAATDPWITLGRTFDRCLGVVQDPAAEVYVAKSDQQVVGFIILLLKGAFTGYIRTVAVHADWRSRGLGSRLIAFAEERIFHDSPNVFMCVSSFNDRARDLYQRLGYEVIGELRDYIVRGHSEWLLRKTIGSYNDFYLMLEPAPASPTQPDPNRSDPI